MRLGEGSSTAKIDSSFDDEIPAHVRTFNTRKTLDLVFGIGDVLTDLPGIKVPHRIVDGVLVVV